MSPTNFLLYFLGTVFKNWFNLANYNKVKFMTVKDWSRLDYIETASLNHNLSRLLKFGTYLPCHYYFAVFDASYITLHIFKIVLTYR